VEIKELLTYIRFNCLSTVHSVIGVVDSVVGVLNSVVVDGVVDSGVDKFKILGEIFSEVKLRHFLLQDIPFCLVT